MDPALTSQLYNIQRTLADGAITGKKIVTEVLVETALTLTVTQDEAEAKANNYLYLTGTATVKIVAYDLTISGSLSFPGRDVVIFTRVLRSRVGANPPAIAVNGLEPPENLPQTKPAPKEKPQVDKGETGEPGYNDTVVGPGGGQTYRNGGRAGPPRSIPRKWTVVTARRG